MGPFHYAGRGKKERNRCTGGGAFAARTIVTNLGDDRSLPSFVWCQVYRWNHATSATRPLALRQMLMHQTPWGYWGIWHPCTPCRECNNPSITDTMDKNLIQNIDNEEVGSSYHIITVPLKEISGLYINNNTKDTVCHPSLRLANAFGHTMTLILKHLRTKSSAAAMWKSWRVRARRKPSGRGRNYNGYYY